MKCPRCQAENRQGAQFCHECGTRFEAVCPACGAQVEAGGRFCDACGAELTVPAQPAATPSRFASPGSYTPKHLADKILTSRSALEGERKQVTVLFVDVSGFTSISERLDPEDVHRLMTRAFELMLAEVHRYEGTVNQFLGDGIMALFGAPIAHEDHAQHAVHAALGIRNALDSYQEDLQKTRGITFQVREGLNTGLVVVGSIGTDLRMDYTAVGDTTNIAARLQQAADRGRILVSEATRRLVEGYFYTRPLGELSLKGKTAPVSAWEVISARQARTRLEVRAERGLTPYVGRERELKLLLECFDKAKAGQGQVVFIVGEPGIGRSRLLYEFRRRLGDEATWLEGRCISFGQSIALHPVIDMMKRNFRIEEGDTVKHALTHDVAYSSLLVQRRRELHLVIALAIEELYADRLAEHHEVLAYHFSKAEDWGRALDYLLKAGDKATRSFANREAIALYDEALEVATRLGDAVDVRTLMAIREAKSNAYFVLSDFQSSRTEGEHLLALARRAGDRVKEGAALAGMGFASLWAHDFDRALAHSAQAIDLATEVNAPPVLAGGVLTTAFVHAVTARLDEARGEFEHALAISRSAGEFVTQSMSLGFLGIIKNWEGNYAEGASRLSEALRIAREHNLLVPLLWTLWISGVVFIGKGDYDDGLAALEEDLGFCEKAGDEVMRHRVLNTLGWLWAEFGDFERAIDLNRRGAEGARKRGDPETIANPEINLADIFVVQGDLVQAEDILDGVHRLVKDPATSDWMRWRYSTRLFASLSDVCLARGDHAKAREWADQCLEIATRTSSRKNLVKGWRLKGEIAMARREWDDARDALQQALTITRAIGNPTQLWKTHLALGRFYDERKNRDAAHEAYRAAREVLDGTRSRLRDERLLASFAAAASIRDIYTLSAPR